MRGLGRAIAGAAADAVRRRVWPETRGGNSTQVAAQVPEPAQRTETCAETATQPGPDHEPGEPAQQDVRASTRCLVGIRADGQSTLRIERPAAGWSPSVASIRTRASRRESWERVAGQSVKVRLRKSGALEIHQPGVARLVVRSEDGVAELSMEARAVDLGGPLVWGAKVLPWATWVLTEGSCSGLGEAGAAGWRLFKVPICADFLGVSLEREDWRRDRWTGVRRRTPMPAHPGDGDEVATFYIGSQRAAVAMKAYCKTRQLAGRELEDSTLMERWRQGGWDGREDVWRFEAELRREALELRPSRDQGHEGVGLDDPATLADPEALARLWAYAFGHPEQPESGRYRLLDAGGSLDPRWRVVQSAAAAAPVEQLAQVRARRQAEREARQRQAERKWIKSVGEVARFDGYTTDDMPVDVLEHMARRTEQIGDEDLHEALVRADALVGDLVEEPVGVTTPQVRDAAGAGHRSTGKEDFRVEGAGAAQKGAM